MVNSDSPSPNNDPVITREVRKARIPSRFAGFFVSVEVREEPPTGVYGQFGANQSPHEIKNQK